MRGLLLAMSDATLITIPILMKNMGLDPAQSSSIMFNNIYGCHWFFLSILRFGGCVSEQTFISKVIKDSEFMLHSNFRFLI
jgi:hypothetical protein